MVRRLIATAALAAAACAPLAVATASTASAATTPTTLAAHAAAAQPPTISRWLCRRSGGYLVRDYTSLTGIRCIGGRFHGYPVYPAYPVY